jgi:hypothetical protein
VSAGVAVAGTATQSAAIELGLEPYDPSRVHGHVVTVETLDALLERLAALPEAERRAVPGLHPDRAPTIVAGVLMLAECLRAFGLQQVEVSEHDILRGRRCGAARIPPPARSAGSPSACWRDGPANWTHVRCPQRSGSGTMRHGRARAAPPRHLPPPGRSPGIRHDPLPVPPGPSWGSRPPGRLPPALAPGQARFDLRG